MPAKNKAFISKNAPKMLKNRGFSVIIRCREIEIFSTERNRCIKSYGRAFRYIHKLAWGFPSTDKGRYFPLAATNIECDTSKHSISAKVGP